MVTPLTIASVLGIVGDKVLIAIIGKGAEKATDALIKLIKNDKSKKAFQQALGQAIQRYATNGNRLTYAKPLLEHDGPLTEGVVAGELARILKFGEKPDYHLIGSRWKLSFEQAPAWIDFDAEAKLLVGYLREELRVSEVFGPVLDSNNLNAINLNVANIGDILENIENQLNEIHQMAVVRFGDLVQAFGHASGDIHSQIIDFAWFIEEKTREFAGRRFIFDKVALFLKENSRGYLIIRGDPGIGKSALATEMVKRNGYIHHFISRPLGINRAKSFLKNVCAQLIAAYQLKYFYLPQETTRDAQFFIKLLKEVSDRLNSGEKAVIVVDALDEVENVDGSIGANLLYLPTTLPNGIYFVLTARKTDLRLKVECEQETVIIEQDSETNLQDIREYIQYKVLLPGIQTYITSQGIDQDLFIDHLVEKSQGNFMYLRYVLPEIERGAYHDLALSKLPAGLMNYYEDHWRRMRGLNEPAWIEYKLPVMIALSIVKEPISIDRIAAFSKVTDPRRIFSVLREWEQFLYERKVDYQGNLQKRYRLYHDSFREFIAGKDEVEGEYVNLKNAHRMIADSLLAGLLEGEEHS